MNKFEFVLNQAARLHKSGKKITGGQLVILLNQNGYTTNYGTQYVGGRGVYKLIHAVYDWQISIGQKNNADIIAYAFTNQDGEYAYP